MKKWLWIILLVVLLIIFSCQKEKKDMHDMLHSAMDNLAAGKVSEGTNLLIDVVLLTHPHEELPEKFKEKLLSAKNYFQSQDFGKASELVSEALVVFKSGLEGESQTLGQESAEVPETDVEQQVFPVAQMIKENIIQAVEEFKSGNRDKGVILILESLELFGPPTK